MNGEFYPEDSKLVNELRRGFENIGRDIRMSLSTVNSGIERMAGDMKYGAGLASNASRTFREGAGGKTYKFINETFSKEFNKPALWSRDMTYMLGKDPRDMSRSQAQHYAKEHWDQRFKQLGSFMGKDVGGFASWLGGPGAAIAYEGFVAPNIVNQKALGKWKSYLDQSSQSYVLGGVSQNTVTGRGWSSQQQESIGRFHLEYERQNKYFNKDEQFKIEQMATSQGYYQKTTSMAQYKQKYRELIDGTKEVMKTLHMSMEEAVGVMSDLNKMKIPNKTGFVKDVSLAAAHSGLSSEQVMRYANAVGTGMTNLGFNKGYGAEVATQLLMQPAKDYAAGNISKYTNRKDIMAGFFTSGGKWDVGAYEKFMSGKTGFGELINKGIGNVGNFMANDTWFDHINNRERIMSENIAPEQMVRMGTMLDYRAFEFKFAGMGWDKDKVFGAYIAEKKRTGSSVEELENIETMLKTPLKGKTYNMLTRSGTRAFEDKGIFGKIGALAKRGWGETVGWASGSFSDTINRYGYGFLSTGWMDIEKKGRLDEDFVTASRIQMNENVRARSKELGINFDLQEYTRFKADESKLGITWNKKTYKAHMLRQAQEKYNKYVNVITGEDVAGVSSSNVEVIKKDIMRELEGIEVSADSKEWFHGMERSHARWDSDDVNRQKEFQRAAQLAMQEKMGGNYKKMDYLLLDASGISKEQRILAEKKEESVWNTIAGEYQFGMDSDILRSKIQGWDEWGKYTSGKYKDKTLVEIADIFSAKISNIKGIKGSTYEHEDFAGALINEYSWGGENALIKTLVNLNKDPAVGSGTREEVMSGLIESGSGMIGAEEMNTIIKTIWTLKESVEAMHTKITGEKPAKIEY